MKKIMLIIMALILVSCSQSAIDVMGDVSGYYEGSIYLEDMVLPVTLNLEIEDKLTGYVDITVQNAYDLTMEEVTYKEDEIKFSIELGQSRGYFSGVITDGHYKGEFIQNGIVNQFAFFKSDKPSTQGIESYVHEIDGITITGEIMLPEDKSSYPIAIIIAGSGMTDMNGNSNAGVYTNMYKYMADALKEEGIASLRYNKRSIGNPVIESEMSFDNFVEDAVAIVKSIELDERFTEVYLIGHSQGALIAQLVTEQVDVSKIVLVAGTGRSIDEVLMSQIEGQIDEESFNAFATILEENKKGNSVDDIPESLSAIIRPSVQPFLISWMKHDPATIISKMDNEILIINGSTDIQVPVSDGELLSIANSDAQLTVIPNMNHVLKEVGDDRDENIKTYQDINLPLHSGFVDVLIDFLNQ